MVIQVDTREKDNKYIIEFFKKIGIVYKNYALPYGDYALINDNSLVVDKKSAGGGLNELCVNIVHDHARFKRELVGAKESGIKLVFLIQEEEVASLSGIRDWDNPRLKHWNLVKDCQEKGEMLNYKIAKKPPVDNLTLFNQLVTIKERYDCDYVFSKKENMGAEIIRILTGIN